jgi:hypothetical protein
MLQIKKIVKKLKFPHPFQIYEYNGDDLFSYLTDFSYFPLYFPPSLNVAGHHGQIR